MNFLSGMLRDEGGLDYKAAIADTIIIIIEDNPEAKDNGMNRTHKFYVVECATVCNRKLALDFFKVYRIYASSSKIASTTVWR